MIQNFLTRIFGSRNERLLKEKEEEDQDLPPDHWLLRISKTQEELVKNWETQLLKHRDKVRKSNEESPLAEFRKGCLVLVEVPYKIKEDILAIDINTLTPVEALLKLNEIKRAFII